MSQYGSTNEKNNESVGSVKKAKLYRSVNNRIFETKGDFAYGVPNAPHEPLQEILNHNFMYAEKPKVFEIQHPNQIFK